MSKEVSTVKRHISSALRVFLAAFIGSMALTITSFPVNGIEDFLKSLLGSAVVAWISAVLKMYQESLLK